MGDGDAENADSSCKRVLLGNKCDVPDARRVVPYQRAAQLSQQLQLRGAVHQMAPATQLALAE